ncbi:MAG: aminotransferase class V-fold PLP-dependent enzyme [Defluviitaleaceae bacterium]|nr:aminotransferase class V-fold PLP-dependent enzyme [Defluviitaleaceae bacterium]
MKYLQDKMIKPYRKSIIGINNVIQTHNGEKKLIYADWAASGRLYRTIEEKIINEIGSFYGNTHSNDSYIGRYINSVYEQARATVLDACKATEKYELLTGGSGATFALHRFQEIMSVDKVSQSVVFISSFEHNTNYLTWVALGAEVVIVDTDVNGVIDLNILEEALKKYVTYDLIIGSFTACSNVTGIVTNYVEAVRIIKKYNGIVVVDYSAMAPHASLDFSNGDIDAAFWGIHKFLGGPSGPGVLLFKPELYKCETPTIPAGGTVLWADPKQRFVFFDEISKREDPGTPAILQTVRAGLAHQLIDEIGSELMHLRESYFTNYLIDALTANSRIRVFAPKNLNRMPIISFVVNGLSYSIVTKALSDFYGIQARGGCSCAAIYAHELLKIDDHSSYDIHNQVKDGIYGNKPGWVRISLHATMTQKEVKYIADAINEIATNQNFFFNKY